MLWKNDWPRAQQHFEEWWRQEGLVLWLTAPLDTPREELPKPAAPADTRLLWCDPEYRFRSAEYQLARTYFGGDAFPIFDTQIGPGSLACFVGCEPRFAPDTVWYEPCIKDPDTHPAIRFDPTSWMFAAHCDLIRRAQRGAQGRFLTGLPDLLEHFDSLAAMRDPQKLMFDVYDRPDWVKRCCRELNEAYRQAFDGLRELILDEDGGTVYGCFMLYGKGRTAKVQCDAAAMLSPEVFAEFVAPPLREQCAWLDYSVFHLDGTDSLRHLDHLLAIEELNAIQWTPQGRSDLPGPGDPHWYGLYRRILQAGKSVQVGARPEQVIPLLEALGPDGVFVWVSAASERQARELEQEIEPYRQKGSSGSTV